MEVADRETACESSSSGLSPKRMPHYPIGILFYYYSHALETLVSSSRNQKLYRLLVPPIKSIAFDIEATHLQH